MGTPQVKHPRPGRALCSKGVGAWGVLADGTYDALVVDATDTADGAVALDVTVLAGPHKGELVTITATGLGRDSLDLLAVPATLVVLDGRPRITLEG